MIEGRNAVWKHFVPENIDKIFVLDGCQDGSKTIVREAKKHGYFDSICTKERLIRCHETGKHQGVIAYAAAYEYAQI